MTDAVFASHAVETPSGRIAYVETGTGRAALFVHGVLLNKRLWRHQMKGLADLRRCISYGPIPYIETLGALRKKAERVHS